MLPSLVLLYYANLSASSRLGRTCKCADSSFPGKLNLKLLPPFTAVRAVVKLPVRGAEIKRLSVRRIHHQRVPSDDIERPDFRRDFFKTCPTIGALVDGALVLGSAGGSRRCGGVDDVGLAGMEDNGPQNIFSFCNLDPASSSFCHSRRFGRGRLQSKQKGYPDPGVKA